MSEPAQARRVSGWEEAFVAAVERRQAALWARYAGGSTVDLGGVESELHALCREGRRLGRDGPGPRLGLVARVAARGLVDFDPAVSRLRNRLDDPAGYPGGMAAGEAMEPEVLALIILRNRLARTIGFPSYEDLAMWSEGLDPPAVEAFAASLAAEAVPPARELARREGISWSTWWEAMARIAGPAQEEAVSLARRLPHLIGLADLASSLTWVVRDQPIYGVASAVSVPSDVRILLGRSQSLHGVMVAIHELGHGLAHAGNRGQGLARTWDVTHDEVVASIMERIGAEVLLGPEDRRRLASVNLLETARLATSLLFEAELNRRPDEARELYRRHHAWLGPVAHPAAWAADSFRSVDPFHVHAYLVGAGVAEATVRHLAGHLGDDPSAWGPWLREGFYESGRARHVLDKAAGLGIRLDPGIARLRHDGPA